MQGAAANKQSRKAEGGAEGAAAARRGRKSADAVEA